jgi:hypothetical protein
MQTPFQEFFEKENWVPKEVQEVYLKKEWEAIIKAHLDGNNPELVFEYDEWRAEQYYGEKYNY